jgi:hypothetical protein
MDVNNKGAITTSKQKDIDINRVNRSCYLNPFSAAAEKTLNGTYIAPFKWNIRYL